MCIRDSSSCGVEQHDIAHGTLLPLEHTPHDCGVLLGSATDEIVNSSPGDAEVARIEIVLGERAAADLPDVGVAGRCQFVEPVVAPKHERRRSPKPEQVGKEPVSYKHLDVDKGQVETKVELGVSDGTMVEVKSGLKEGDQVRQFVPGIAAPVEEFCYEVSPGEEVCETGTSW